MVPRRAKSLSGQSWHYCGGGISLSILIFPGPCYSSARSAVHRLCGRISDDVGCGRCMSGSVWGRRSLAKPDTPMAG